MSQSPPDRRVVAEFRAKQPDNPRDLRAGRYPEFNPGEIGVTCYVCGYWGIIPDDAVAKNAAHPSTDGELVCRECEQRGSET